MDGWQILRNRTRENEKLQIAGWRFGRIVSVAAVAPPKGHYHKNTATDVLFKCDCGKVFKVPVKSIKRKGVPDTCPKCPLGSLEPKKRKENKRKKNRPQFKVKGMTWKELTQRYKREFRTWQLFRKTYCKRWRESFEWFIHDMGERPRGAQLCRQNRKKLHGPKNSYWGMKNEDRSLLTWNGRRVIRSWAERRFGVPSSYIIERCLLGETRLEDIIIRYDALIAKRKKEAAEKQQSK